MVAVRLEGDHIGDGRRVLVAHEVGRREAGGSHDQAADDDLGLRLRRVPAWFGLHHRSQAAQSLQPRLRCRRQWP